MEAFAQSSVELVELAEGAVYEFKKIHVGVAEDLNGRLIHGLSNLFKDYILFVASCGKTNTLFRFGRTNLFLASQSLKIWVPFRIKARLHTSSSDVDEVSPRFEVGRTL